MKSNAEILLNLCRERSLRLATAESCTGGMIAAALTDIPGSSDVFDRGFVTYSNVAKQDMLGVPESLIADVGAVSEAVAKAMAEGALRHSQADMAVSVTGIAGPGGATEHKKVGLVYIAVADKVETICKEWHFDGNRKAVRQQAVEAALGMMLERIG